jgi:predicted CopG family antitoxin
MCMATKTISLRLEAYDRLRRAKRHGESFSDVVMRARWPEETITAGELLRRYREGGGVRTAEALDRIEAAKSQDRPPEDKWTG